MLNELKYVLLKLFMGYERWFPIQRGKFFLSRILTWLLGEVKVKTDNGVWIVVIPFSVMDRSYLSSGNTSHELVLREIDKLEKGDVFVDIGANIGFYSFIASHKVGPDGLVFSFEPSHREYRRLLQGIELNKATNIVPFNCALSDQSGVQNFKMNPYHTGLNRLDESNKKDGIVFYVPTLRADVALPQQKIDLIKIDVEGAEHKVLEGLRSLLEQQQIVRVVVEITPSFLEKYSTSKDQLYAYMNAHHYKPLVNANHWQYDEIFILNDNH